jgi:hypothetical protein
MRCPPTPTQQVQRLRNSLFETTARPAAVQGHSPPGRPATAQSDALRASACSPLAAHGVRPATVQEPGPRHPKASRAPQRCGTSCAVIMSK